MGNYKFRLSDMMPNAWFYKLKDMSSRTRKCNTTSSHSIKKKLPRSTTTTTSQRPHLSQPRYYSYHLTTTEPNKVDKFCNSPINPKASDTHFPDQPRKSSKKKSKRKSIYKPSPRLVSSTVSAGCSCRATFNSVCTKPADTSHQYEDYSVYSTDSSPEHELFHECLLPEFESDTVVASDRSSSSHCSCNCRVSSSTKDIIIDMNEKSFTRKIEKLDDFVDTFSELDLPPILTKPPKFNLSTTEATRVKRSSTKLEETLSVKIVKEDRIKSKKESNSNLHVLARKPSSTSSTTGIKLHTNTPRIASRKIQGCGRKSISSTTTTKSRSRKFSESFAVVKSSKDPERDFRDSMMEMIVENNIRASKDLEELLACYLLLNSNEYHDLIVKAFEHIWFDMTEGEFQTLPAHNWLKMSSSCLHSSW